MSRVLVKQNILSWALNRSGKSREELKKDFPKIQQWFEGSEQPTIKQLESFANKTSTPFGFFFLDEPPNDIIPIPYFRSLRNGVPKSPSPELIETIQIMQRRQSWLREYLIEEDFEKLSFVKSVSLNDDFIFIANKMKEQLGLAANWASKLHNWEEALNLLSASIENTGIIVAINGIVGNNTHRKLQVDEFRGFVLVDDYAPLIFVNNSDSKAAQMFTLAHELAHVFLGSSAAFDLREMQPADEPSEQICNKAAAEFLVPHQELHKIWNSIKKGNNPFQEIAKHFKVSELVVARRTLDLGLITKKEFFDFYNDYIAKNKQKPKQSGGDYYASQSGRIGRKFAQIIDRAVGEGKLLYSEAYRLTGVYGSTYEKYMMLVRDSR